MLRALTIAGWLLAVSVTDLHATAGGQTHKAVSGQYWSDGAGDPSLRVLAMPDGGVVALLFVPLPDVRLPYCMVALRSGGRLDSEGRYPVSVTDIPGSETPETMPTVAEGTLGFQGTAAHLELPEQSLVDLCGDRSVQYTDSRFELETAEPSWRDIRLVNTQKAVLHHRPETSDGASAYLVLCDIVYVTEDRGDWSHVVYTGKPEVDKAEGLAHQTGWVESSKLSPFPRPRPVETNLPSTPKEQHHPTGV